MQMTRVLTAALVLAGSCLAQSTDRMKWPDIGIFGGYQGWDLWRSQFKNQPGGELTKSGVLGARASYNFTSHLALEGAYTFGGNNLRLFPDTSGGAVRIPRTELGASNHHFSLNPVWHFLSPESRWRPYVTAGIGALSFRPSGGADRDVRNNSAAYGALGLKSDLMAAFNWGGGVKYNLTDLFQLRFDVRNILSKQPHFGLPPTAGLPGGVFVANGGTASGLQATAGIGFNLNGRNGTGWSTGSGSSGSTGAAGGGRSLRLNLAGGASPIKQDGSVKLAASTDAPNPATVSYIWTVNGMGTDVTGPEFVFNAKGKQPGDYKICATATSTVKGWQPGSECYTVTIEAAAPLKATVTDPVKINAGQSTTLTAGTDAPAGETVTYEWTLNGQPIPGVTGNTYTFNSEGRQPGVYDICVTATAHGVKSEKQCTSVNVVACSNPTLSIGALPLAEIFAGQRVNIPATAQPGSCGSPVRLSYRAGDGTISNTGEFDSTNVAFDRTNRSKLQRKSVPITVTATDERGNAATAQTSVIVKLGPEAQRLDDLLFSSRSSRVNNCDKRVLLEILTPRLRDDPEAQVLLVGHVDDLEARTPAARRGNRRARRRAAAAASQLDKARALNAAAVISAGQGICPSLDLSRVKVAYAGKSQASELRPTFCGSSTEVRATKRKGAKADARAPQRRVEVWIVPAGAAMPPGVTVASAPASEIKALKCPK